MRAIRSAWGQGAGDRGHVRGLLQRGGQVCGDVLGGVDEPAEHDRVIPVGQQPGHDLGDLGELRIQLGALEGFGVAGEAEQAAAFRGGLGGVGVRVRAGGGVRGLQGLVVGQVHHRGPAQLVGLGQGVGGGVRGPGAQGGRRGPRGRGQGAQQGQGRPPAHPLVQLTAAGVGDGLPAVGQDLVEQGPVLGGEGVGAFLGEPVPGERGVLTDEVPDVAASALHEVPGQMLPAGHLLQVDVAQGRVEQLEQVAEARVPARSAGWR